MKNIILTSLLALLLSTIGKSQKIEIDSVRNRQTYSYNGHSMTLKDIHLVVQDNPESLELINKARTNSTIISILSYSGGFLIGWPLGTAIGGGEPNWALAGIGAGLVVISIPLIPGMKKNTLQAVETYNDSINSTSYRHPRPSLELTTNGAGLGIAMRF